MAQQGKRKGPAAPGEITLKGVRVHNLKNLSLSLPRRRLVVVTGPSGSGKSSLAYDTLYAEGQRRYIESLSSYAHQFLEARAVAGLVSRVVVSNRSGRMIVVNSDRSSQLMGAAPLPA